MPFETEYQILVKNNDFKNVRLDIDIDGGNVTNEGIVIRSGYTVYLERFLNSQNKFKFVPVSNEGVGDPTSKENGIITVTGHFELPAPKPVEPVYNYKKSFCGLRGNMKGSPRGSVAGGSAASDNSVHTDWMKEEGDVQYSKGCEPQVNTSGGILNFSEISTNFCSPGIGARECDYSMNTIATRSIGQAGATVEGAKSNQQFTQVHWRGDDPAVQAVTFKFKLLGMDNRESKEWQEYMRLKEKFQAA